VVDVVLALEPEPARLGLGVVDRPLRDAARLTRDLGALHHPLGLEARGVDDLVGLAPGLLEELVTLLEQPPGMTHLVGEGGENLIDQAEHLLAVDQH
jgi:hypothetical protein